MLFVVVAEIVREVVAVGVQSTKVAAVVAATVAVADELDGVELASPVMDVVAGAAGVAVVGVDVAVADVVAFDIAMFAAAE